MLSSCEKTWKNLKCTLLSEKKASLKRLRTVLLQLYDFLKKANYRDSKKISGSQGFRGGQGVHMWSTEDFQGHETILYGILMLYEPKITPLKKYNGVYTSSCIC